MLTTATEKVKLYRVAYGYNNGEYVEQKVKYFTDGEEAVKFVRQAWINTNLYVGKIFADEVTALVTFNKE